MNRRQSPLSDSPRFESFIKKRDTALDDLLYKHLNVLDRALDHFKSKVTNRFAIMSIQIPNPGPFYLKKLSAELDRQLSYDLAEIETVLSAVIHRLRSGAYALSSAGQAEAIGRATGKRTRYRVTKEEIQKRRLKPMPSGGTVEQRIWIALERLKRKILDAYHMGCLLEESPQETLSRMLKAFPSTVTLSRPRRVLKHPKLKERDLNTDPDIPDSASSGIIDGDTWRDLVDDYLSQEVPFFVARAPGKQADSYYAEHDRYQWELEQEVTQDFVTQVRDGEVDTAKHNGIDDFMWIAVIDSHTDECCQSRDGLSTSDIEKGISSGSIDDDDCDAVVPPAHFNCRCRIAPMAELPEETPPNLSEFDDWLDARANSS